jgi:hypothetical protein
MLLMTFSAFPISLSSPVPSCNPRNTKNVAKMFLIFCSSHTALPHRTSHCWESVEVEIEKCASKEETQKPLSITQFVAKNFNVDIPIRK